MIQWLLKVAVLFIVLTSIIAIGKALKSDNDLENRIFSRSFNPAHPLPDNHFTSKKHFRQS